MTAVRARRPRAVQAVLAAVVAGGLAACTGTDAGPTAAAPSPAGDLTPPPGTGSVATDPPRPSTPEVVLSRAGWDEVTMAVEAAGYLSPLVEDGGACTLELTRDGTTRTAEAAGVADATTTICGGLAVPGSELSPGGWTAVLRYRSPGVEAVSAPLPVEVPE